MSKKYSFERQLFGCTITADMTILDNGIHILLYGGEESHIGAITVVSPDGQINTTAFKGHREDQLSQKWAQKISHKKKLPVVVEAGIHYDHATLDQIQEILSVCDELLEEVVASL